MMQKRRGALAAEQAREPDLPAGRGKQILTANHEIDLLVEIVDADGELISPVAPSIADQHVAALLRRIVLLRSEPPIDEALDAGVHAHAPANAVDQRNPAPAAMTVVDKFSIVANV